MSVSADHFFDDLVPPARRKHRVLISGEITLGTTGHRSYQVSLRLTTEDGEDVIAPLEQFGFGPVGALDNLLGGLSVREDALLSEAIEPTQ